MQAGCSGLLPRVPVLCPLSDEHMHGRRDERHSDGITLAYATTICSRPVGSMTHMLPFGHRDIVDNTKPPNHRRHGRQPRVPALSPATTSGPVDDVPVPSRPDRWPAAGTITALLVTAGTEARAAATRSSTGGTRMGGRQPHRRELCLPPRLSFFTEQRHRPRRPEEATVGVTLCIGDAVQFPRINAPTRRWQRRGRRPPHRAQSRCAPQCQDGHRPPAVHGVHGPVPEGAAA